MTVDLSKLLTAQGRKDAEWVLSFPRGSEWHSGAFRPNREAELVRAGVLVETSISGVFTVGPRVEPTIPAIIPDGELRAAARRIVGLRGPEDLAVAQAETDAQLARHEERRQELQAETAADDIPAGARGRRAYRDAPSAL